MTADPVRWGVLSTANINDKFLAGAGGAIGALRAIRANFSFNLLDAANVRLDASLQGGALMDVGCYCVNAVRLLAGEPVRVSGMATMVSGVDTRFAGVLEMPEGVLA